MNPTKARTVRCPRPTDSEPLHLAVALDGTGWHPASWREPDARPTRAAEPPGTGPTWSPKPSAACWTSSPSRTASRLQSDDTFRADDRADRVRGRLDAVLIASRVAPLTRHIGLVPTAVVTHTEPFHLSKAIATLDYVSSGRAGVRVQVAPSPEAARTSATDIPSCPRPRSPTRTHARSRPPRRGGGLRRGAAPAVGQLGGRRRDPRRRDRPVRRPEQAALHRLRGRHVLRQGTVDHPEAAAGPTDRRRARPRRSRVRAHRGQRRRRIRHAARRRRTPTAIVDDHRVAATPPGWRRSGCSPTSWCSSPTPWTRPGRGRHGSTSAPAPNIVSDARDLRRARPAELADLLEEWHAGGR